MPVHATTTMAAGAAGIGAAKRSTSMIGTASPCARPAVRGVAISSRMSVLMEAYKLVPCGDMSVEHMEGDYENKPIPELVIEKNEAIIGRDEDRASLLLPIPTVSGAHAKIEVSEGKDGIMVTDLGSTNGTYIDGKQIESGVTTQVKPSQTVVFGDEHLAAFKVEAEESTGET